MIVRHMDADYRLTEDGRIEFFLDFAERWIESGHTNAGEEEIPVYERHNHPLLPLLREKFNRNKATPPENHS